MECKGHYKLGQCNRKVETLENTVSKAVSTSFTVPTVADLQAGAMKGCISPVITF